MRLAIVGGIYDMDADYRSRIRHTPETILADGLERRGHDVTRLGHRDLFDPSGFDLVHVHHAGWGVVTMASSPPGPIFVYTNHRSLHHGIRDRFVEWLALRSADRIVALSDIERQRLMARRGVPSDVVARVPNGVDASVYEFAPPEPPTDGIWRLLFVGQLIPKKAVDVLIRAFRVVLNSTTAHLELVFHNDSERPQLSQLAESLNLGEAVAFTGPLAPEALFHTYARSHVVALSSLSEALPSVVTEAMFVGRRVVATDVGSIAEQVGEFGVLVEPGDVESLASGLLRAIATYPAFCAMDADRMQARARQRYSLEAMIDGHESLYHDAVGQTRHRRSRPLARASSFLANEAGRGLGAIGMLRRPDSR